MLLKANSVASRSFMAADYEIAKVRSWFGFAKC